jgi:hypothetical protein
MTLRLATANLDPDEDVSPFGMMINLASFVFNSIREREVHLENVQGTLGLNLQEEI